jgi:hypothetical protein
MSHGEDFSARSMDQQAELKPGSIFVCGGMVPCAALGGRKRGRSEAHPFYYVISARSVSGSAKRWYYRPRKWRLVSAANWGDLALLSEDARATVVSFAGAVAHNGTETSQVLHDEIG